ncbi:hypothetical protein, partial [Paenibacillus peoriae]|uniref:hypothetical protein n=1 Tax=Paenibacillus peoriae TaxID=59893 RepID=UPI0019D6D74E
VFKDQTFLFCQLGSSPHQLLYHIMSEPTLQAFISNLFLHSLAILYFLAGIRIYHAEYLNASFFY